MSYLPKLRDELVKAARRQHEPAAAEPGRQHWVRRAGRLIPVLVALAVMAAVVVVALTVSSRHANAPAPARPRPPVPALGAISEVSGGSSHSGVGAPLEVMTAANQTVARDRACAGSVAHLPVRSSGQPSLALRTALGVLRLPATGDQVSSAVLDSMSARDVYAGAIRRARSAFGMTFYIVPAGNVTGIVPVPARCAAEQRQALTRALAHRTAGKRAELLKAQALFIAQEAALAAHPEGICIVESTPGNITRISTDCGYTLATIESGRVFSVIDGHPGALFAGVVPDGVASVTLRYGLVTVTADVVRNVFASRYPHGVATTVLPQITWHSADGRVIRTIPGFGR